MHSSPVRRFTSVLLHLLARLACIRRAASVRSEPGSNSHKGSIQLDPRVTSSIHLTLLISRSIQLSKNCCAFRASRATYYARPDLVKTVRKYFFDLGFLRIRRGDLLPHRPLGWIKRALLYQSACMESSLAFNFLLSQSRLMKNWLRMRRRSLLKLSGIAAAAGLTGGCDAVGSVFGRMFAMPPRETNYYTQNNKFYVVNYSDSPFNVLATFIRMNGGYRSREKSRSPSPWGGVSY